MEFKGKVIRKSQRLPAGQTEKVDIQFEELKEEYPNNLVVTFLWDKNVASTDDIDVGDTVGVDYNTKVSEYNGKRYNNINAWKITSLDKSTAVEEEKDDLPF